MKMKVHGNIGLNLNCIIFSSIGSCNSAVLPHLSTSYHSCGHCWCDCCVCVSISTNLLQPTITSYKETGPSIGQQQGVIAARIVFNFSSKFLFLQMLYLNQMTWIQTRFSLMVFGHQKVGIPKCQIFILRCHR